MSLLRSLTNKRNQVCTYAVLTQLPIEAGTTSALWIITLFRMRLKFLTTSRSWIRQPSLLPIWQQSTFNRGMLEKAKGQLESPGGFLKIRIMPIWERKWSQLSNLIRNREMAPLRGWITLGNLRRLQRNDSLSFHLCPARSLRGRAEATIIITQLSKVNSSFHRVPCSHRIGTIRLTQSIAIITMSQPREASMNLHLTYRAGKDRLSQWTPNNLTRQIGMTRILISHLSHW
jgi:hypothetical protein